MENYNTPYDDVFRTLLEKCSSLIIPVINEVFNTEYKMEEKVTLLANELFEKKEDGNVEKRVTDAHLMIHGNIYHIECQSRPDSTMQIRMIEYDFHIALSGREEKEGEQILRFPESAVLYLRHTKNTPDKLQVRLILPNKEEVCYSVPIIKVQEYTKEDILEKNLFFFIPYYILKFEKELEYIDRNREELEKLVKDYQDIYERVKKLESQKIVNQVYLHNLITLTGRLINVVANQHINIKREVNQMGGKVLELESEKIMENAMKQGLQRGIEQGIQQGIQQGIERGRIKATTDGIIRLMYKKKMTFEEACDFYDIKPENYEIYQDALKTIRKQEE